MNKRFAFSLAVAALCVGCAMDEMEEHGSGPSEKAPEYIAVSLDNTDSKVHMSGHTPIWHTTDNLSVFWKSDAQHRYDFESMTEDGAARFVFKSTPVAGSRSLPMNYAIHPYRTNDNKVTSSGVASTRIINTQIYDPANLIDSAPMVAVSDGNEFEFRNVASLLRFNIRKSDDFLSECFLEKITLVSNNQVLSGMLEVDTSESVFVGRPAGTPRNNNVHLSLGDGGVEITSQPKPFCLSVFPGKYPAGDLTITLIYNNGLTRVVNYPAELELKANSVQDIDCEISPVPSGECIRLTADCHAAAPLTVSELLFGSFSEMHGGDLVPGVCEQYIVNTSFEPWYGYGDVGETKNELVFTGSQIAADPDVAYPWEKRVSGASASFSVTTEEKKNTAQSQKISLQSSSSAVLLQRLALPLYRETDYKLRFHAKVDGNVSVKVAFHGVNDRETVLLSDEYSPVISGSGWNEYSHEFTLEPGSVMFNNRHTQYNLWMEFSGTGTVYVDHVTLFPSDCIDGIFNPETIEYFKKYNVKAIRWPGGNFTSGYNWKNGVGDWVDRPCLKNKAWGGLDSNFLGTDEFLRFCEITGAEPIMGVGYNPSLISEQDIEDWVRYCKTFGHDVKYWGIGNEVYGNYQLGTTSAASYASGLSSISAKMKTVDPDISILASGCGVHNYYRGTYPNWTETVSSSASSAFDLFDCHLYVYGNDTSAAMNLSGEEFFRVFSAANLTLRDFVAYMREVAPGKELAFLEWGVLPRLSGLGYMTPQRQTFANMLLTACEYHEMIRNCDIVKMAALHNFSFYVSPQTLHSEPVNMRTEVLRELSALSGGRYIPMDDSGFPVYDQTVDMLDVGVRTGVSEIDAVAVLKDNTLYISCVNRNPSGQYALSLDVCDDEICSLTGRVYTCPSPYDRSLWNNVVDTVVSPLSYGEDGLIVLPALSYMLIEIALEKQSPSANLNPYGNNGKEIDIQM